MWTKQIKRSEGDWLFNIGLTNTERERTKRKEKKREIILNERIYKFFLSLFIYISSILNTKSVSHSHTQNMYNTSGSDMDMEEFEYNCGSRKVSRIILLCVLET